MFLWQTIFRTPLQKTATPPISRQMQNTAKFEGVFPHAGTLVSFRMRPTIKSARSPLADIPVIFIKRKPSRLSINFKTF